MPNPEHLEILRQGVKVWNEWRSEHKDVRPDFSGANLRGANLRDVDLRDANLSLADLTAATLKGANLNVANLSHTVLSHTDLSHTDLDNADLRLSNLSGTDLSSANLFSADLSDTTLCDATLRDATLIYTNLFNANLSRADFTEATLVGAMFVDNDLSEVKGLETVTHNGPSSIGIDTLYKSGGRIPEAFLRGCGVPESFVVQVRALVASAEPIQFYKSFISYSSKDQKFADTLYADLQNKGVRCWLATEDLRIGEKIRRGIDEAIRMHDKLLLVLSKHSVVSDWVEQEVETALERERKEKRLILFPIRLDDAVMKIEGGWPALIRNTRNVGDFRKWKQHDSYQKAFDRLLRDLKAEEKP
jgi:hypothetical protein